MEALEKARLRNHLRLSDSILQPTVIRTLDDIKRVVANLGPNQPHIDIPINTKLEEAVSGKKVVYEVSANTKSKSQRDILLDGFDVIKSRRESLNMFHSDTIEINGRKMALAKLNANVDGFSWIDPLIKQWTGGERKGTLITWDIGDGYEYRYEIYSHTLSRIRQK